MKRRAFLALAATSLSLSALPSFAEMLDYTPNLVKSRLDKGETVFLDFKASWCSTCRAQERTINALRKADPTYDAKITFINVDWDDHGDGALAKSLNIPRRSTLVVLRGNKELGRIVADTSKKSIKALMDTAAAASGS